MSGIKWLIETEKWGEDVTRIVNSVRRQGMEVKSAEYPQDSGSYLNICAAEDCVIYFGSLDFAAKVRRESKLVPGVYYHPTDYDCISYYPKLGKYLLNSDYICFRWETCGERNNFYTQLLRKKILYSPPEQRTQTIHRKVNLQRAIRQRY